MGVYLCLRICGTSKIEDILLLCFSFISVDVIKKITRSSLGERRVYLIHNPRFLVHHLRKSSQWGLAQLVAPRPHHGEKEMKVCMLLTCVGSALVLRFYRAQHRLPGDGVVYGELSYQLKQSPTDKPTSQPNTAHPQ